MRYSIYIEHDENDYRIEVLDWWKHLGYHTTLEIIPPKTWFWRRNKFIKEKIAEQVKYLKEKINNHI